MIQPERGFFFGTKGMEKPSLGWTRRVENEKPSSRAAVAKHGLNRHVREKTLHRGLVLPRYNAYRWLELKNAASHDCVGRR